MIGDLFDILGEAHSRYPEVAGTKEHDINSASRKAGEGVPVKALQRVVHADLLRHGDATADECAARLGMDVLTIRPRFSELRRLSLLVATSERRPSSRGVSSTVWHALSAPADGGAL
jgi:transcription initiation factor IIE alpha subunit